MSPLPTLLFAAAGLALGSFVATAAIRFARGEAFLGGRSHCDGCGAPLGFAATMPIVSYVGRRGMAGCCHGRIDPVHLVGELLGLAVMLAGAATGDLPHGLLVGGLGLGLLALGLIDLRTGRLPNLLVAAVAAAGLGLVALDGSGRLLEGLAAAAATFAVLEIVRRGFLRFRGRGGFGGGDVKLLAALAVWLGVLTPTALVLASLIGLIQVALLRPRDGRIAFGPAIAAAGFVVGIGRTLLA
jgi:leader peptidase (prepilin peptidase) / N-methyltransferase